MCQIRPVEQTAHGVIKYTDTFTLLMRQKDIRNHKVRRYEDQRVKILSTNYLGFLLSRVIFTSRIRNILPNGLVVHADKND